MLSLLGIQFVLGMILNLYVRIPKVHPGVTGNYFSRSVHSFGWALTNGAGIVLILHILAAIGLLLGAISLLARAISTHAGHWITFSALGLLGVIVALTNGLAFLGYNDNAASSLIMSLGFIFSLTMYSVGLTYSPKAKSAKSETAKSVRPEHTPGHRSYGRFRASHS